MAGACKPSYSGGWRMRIAWTCKAEVAMNWDHTTALQPGWQSETPFQKKQSGETKKEMFTTVDHNHALENFFSTCRIWNF